MKSRYLNFKKFINEDRREEYFEYDPKVIKKTGEVTRITAIEREDIESIPEGQTILKKIEDLTKSLKKNERKLLEYKNKYDSAEGEMRKMFEQVFDSMDDSVTRYIQTKSVTVSLSKVRKGSVTIDYKKAVEMLKELLDDSQEMQDKISAAIEEAKYVSIDYEKAFNTLKDDPDIKKKEKEVIDKSLEKNTKIGRPGKAKYNTIKDGPISKREIPGALDGEEDSVDTMDDERVSEGLFKDAANWTKNRVSNLFSKFKSLMKSIKDNMIDIDRKLNKLESLISE
jgi:hypothetical protein